MVDEICALADRAGSIEDDGGGLNRLACS